jgi:LysM repeat protein
LDIRETETASTAAKSSTGIARSTRFHKVAKGENLYSIARKRGMTVDALCKLNHIRKNAHLRAGQILRYQ